MPTKKGILKPYEELRMRREVDALLSKSKIDYQQMKARQCQEKSSHLTLPSDSCHPHGLPVQVPVAFVNAEGPPSNPQEPGTLTSADLMDFRVDLLQSPPCSVLCDTKAPIPQVQQCMHYRPGEKRASTNPPVNTQDSPVVFKPAIAQLAGTTKAVSMSQRPQPLPKPRSERLPSGQRARKARSPSEQAVDPRTRVAELCVSRQRSYTTLSSKESSESNTSEDSGSDQSARTQHKVRRKKRRTLRPVCQPKLTSEVKLPPSLKGKSTTIVHNVRSTTELLQEARTIAGVEAEGQEEVEGTVATAKTLVRAGRRTVDEIIASLQSGTCTASASDHMIKELMKQVLGDGYFADNEGVNMEAKGETFPLIRRLPRVPLFPTNIQGLAHLATWAPKTDTEEYKTIHHLCTTPASQVLPVELQLVSRVCHTSSSTSAVPLSLQQRAALQQGSEQLDALGVLSEGVPPEALTDPEQEDCVSHLSPENSLALSDWKRIAEYYVERPRIQMHGRSTPLCEREMKMFWNPAPPKFSCAPNFLRDKLFPRYQAARSGHSNEEFLCELEESAETISGSQKSMEQHCTLMRPSSAPLLNTCTDPGLRIKDDFRSIASELEVVKQLRLSLASRDALRRQQQQTLGPGISRDPATAHNQPPTKVSQGDASQSSDAEAERAADPSLLPARYHAHQRRRKGSARGRSGAEDLGHRSAPARRRGGKAVKTLQPAKLAEILRKLKEKPRALLRSESVSRLPQRHSTYGRWGSLTRWPSLPLVLDFQSFAAKRGGIAPEVVEREWVRDIWVVWFDEVFPPLDESISGMIADGQNGSAADGDWAESPEYPQELDNVDLSQTLGEGLTVADLRAEVEALGQAMAQQDTASAFHLCRRGGLYKKLGLLNQAMEDLNQAISLEPGLLNAYWHRHGIYLLRNDHTSALEDLDFIIKHAKKPADAFRSRAEIYRSRGQITHAILNYTHAIKCRPEEDENYFRRAQMYMQTNEILLAVEDYAKTYTTNPKRTDALMIHGVHYFQNANWLVALSDFTSVLRQEPGHAVARTYRGQIHAKLGHFHSAVEDFSLAVHLNPHDWLAFYHRGCLLRKREPEVALRDLSTSVLINDSKDNFSAFLHRGLIYCDLKQWKQAVADFEAVVRLDSTIAVAHVNLGLIYMLKMDQHHEAIQMFTNALRVNPTYIRAYICRAKAFHIVGNLKKALKDLTCATHMRPDAHQLYILRGQFLCDMGLFSLATRCVQYAAQMNQALGPSPLQQAAVHSFLGNNDKAMACLTDATSETPLPILILLGKTQMRARLFPDAMESFKKALALEGNMGHDRAQIYHLMGMCYMSQDLLQQACDAFSNAVKINPDYAEAYHQRGLCRMRLHQVKSVQDLNRALSINPYFFQVYLSRATYYGSRDRYSKAILNCNEAINLQPSSVRAYLYRGAFKYFLKVYNGAVEDLTTAIKLDKSCAFAYYNRAVCYHQMKEYELALRDYAIVLLLPEQREISLKVLINRGLLYVDLNDHHNALVDFLTASEKKPKDPAIHHALGVYHHRLGQLQQSVEAYTEAMRISPFSLDTYVGRGSAYMDYGHTQANKQAQRDFLSALHLNPLCINARICLAYNFQVFGCFQKAWNQFTIALEISPSSWTAYEGRAVVNLQMGNLYAAFQDISKALRHNPLRDQLLTNRGVISQCMGDKSTAMKDYQKAISVNPNYSLAYFNAANLYFFNRRFEKALEYYSKAIELDPGDESAVLNRAITLTLLRKVPEALQDFTRALQLNPYSSHVYLNRANLYCSLRKYRSAERDLTQAIDLQPSDALLYKLRADVRGQLGLTQQALQDYGTSLELQEAQESLSSAR
ncbi:hypothetical protein ACEWY4_005555 [Coilia grayii]|uniref:UDP-N-acetylglucosamine--peptide N-acetylglucosaminyltransferase SPINDLY n=1 Tax=Coilia grayii TaxID=363190 RepID=A0ABD1KIT8_9TELE